MAYLNCLPPLGEHLFALEAILENLLEDVTYDGTNPSIPNDPGWSLSKLRNEGTRGMAE